MVNLNKEEPLKKLIAMLSLAFCLAIGSGLQAAADKDKRLQNEAKQNLVGLHTMSTAGMPQRKLEYGEFNHS